MECGNRKWVLLMLVVGLGLVLVAGVAAADQSTPVAGGQDAGATIQQTKDVLSQVWKVVGPWVQWMKEKWLEVLNIVYQKASFQGVKDVATEGGRIGLDAGTGHPYQAAYKVAQNVPVVGEQVKSVIGEVRLRENARKEEQESEL